MPKRPKSRRPTRRRRPHKHTPVRRKRTPVTRRRVARPRPKPTKRRITPTTKRPRRRPLHRPSSPRRESPRTTTQYFAWSAGRRDVYKRVLQVLSDLRAGKPERQVLQDAEVSRQTVRQLASGALQRRSDGRLVVRRFDRLLRVMYVPDVAAPDGKREIAVRDSPTATLLSEYWRAVGEFMRKGDSSGLSAFRNTSVVTADGALVPLLTDLTVLRRLGNAGLLAFETIYSK